MTPQEMTGHDNYHRLSGISLERLAALSDGVFAVAMTLLVLDLHVPALSHDAGEGQLAHALGHLAPRLLTYFMSFLTLGIFWLAQQTHLHHFTRTDRNLTWIHLLFLCAVALMPFSTGLLAEYLSYRTALVVYWMNLVLLGALLAASLRHATRAGLVTDELPPRARQVMMRRIGAYQIAYAVAVALCAIAVWVSVAALVALQLNSALAPARWLRRRA